MLENNSDFNEANYRLIRKDKKYAYYRVKVQKLHKAYYYIQLENSVKTAVPVLKNKTADELINDAEFILKFGFWMWDVVSDKVFWTKGMYGLLEIEEGDLIKPINNFDADFVIKDDAFLDFEKRFRNGQIQDSYRNKYYIKTYQGNLLTVSEHGRIEYDADGKILKVLGLTRDISLQEQSMKSLSDYKEMMQANELFLNYGTWESDPKGDYIDWTEGMYQLFGYEEAERENLLVNKDLYKRHSINSTLFENEEQVTDFLKGKDEYYLEYEIKDLKESIKVLSTYARLIRNKEGEIEKIIGTTRDVSQLKEYEKTLEKKVAELNRSNLELEEFAYVASHDMQEPLRKISTFAQRLQSKYQLNINEDAVNDIQRIMASTDNMRNLIDNLLEFSRLGQNNYTIEQTDLNKLVNNALYELELETEETGTRIQLEPLPEIEAIPVQMQQLFFNLLGNAIKFRKKGVPPLITVAQETITPALKKKYQLSSVEDFCLITVSDNGIGFEEEYAEKIFKLFQRLQGKFEFPGTGMGLSICKKIVNNHKGQIFANSVPGKGSRFSLILPKKQ